MSFSVWTFVVARTSRAHVQLSLYSVQVNIIYIQPQFNNTPSPNQWWRWAHEDANTNEEFSAKYQVRVRIPLLLVISLLFTLTYAHLRWS